MNGSGTAGSGQNMVQALPNLLMSGRLGDAGPDGQALRDPTVADLSARLRQETATALGRSRG